MSEGHLYLVGFMGAGKSTVGPELAKRLDCPFVDLDRELERRERILIPEIFADQGEAYFRSLESELLRETSTWRPAVIALGGGAFTRPENREVVAENGLSIWLNISFELACCRTEGSLRPLASDPAQFQALYGLRQVVYQKADIEVRVEATMTPDQIVAAVIEKIGKKRN